MDLAINSLDTSDFSQTSQSWKAVCSSTQTRGQVQSQHSLKGIVKTIKLVTLQSFSTVVVHGLTTLKGQEMRLNQIAQPTTDNQLSQSIQFTPPIIT